LSNEVTLYDKEEVIQKARELFGLLEGGDEQHDDEPSDGARSDGVEEEKEEEEAAAAKAANFSLTFRNLPGQPQVTDASGQACISRASMQQQGFEEAPPPVRGGDRASGSSGARPFDSPELAKRVQDHFRTNFCDSDFPKATTSAHGTRREDIVGTVSMGLYAKGGQTPSSCDTGNDDNGSDISDDSDAGEVKQTGQGVLLETYLRNQNELQTTQDTSEKPAQSKSFEVSGTSGNTDAQKVMNEEYNAWSRQKKDKTYPSFQTGQKKRKKDKCKQRRSRSGPTSPATPKAKKKSIAGAKKALADDAQDQKKRKYIQTIGDLFGDAEAKEEERKRQKK